MGVRGDVGVGRVRLGFSLVITVAVALACGGLPIDDLPVGDGATDEVAVDPEGGGDGEIVPVVVHTGDAVAEPEVPEGDADPVEPEPEPEPAPKEKAKSPDPEPKGKAKAEQPDPKPDPKPDPEPSEPKPAPVTTGPKGAVKVEGPGRVVLFNQETGRHTVPGDVPVGTYVIRVKFGEKPVVATGKVKVTEAGLTIKCIESMGLCRPQ